MERAWWRGAVIYQIYPRSFFDSDDDGTGDLRGITAKLDYVASLGVDAIWLSPFFRSPMKDFGYDISDYQDVDPVFGALADFDALLARAHALGLKVIIDQVYSHTSDQHPWFVDSSHDRTGPRADWYVWADPKPDGTPPNNWLSVFGGPAWTWGPERRQYYLNNFLSEQPDLDLRRSAVQQAIFNVAAFWLDRGVDGFRLDVVNFYVHDAALRDNPPAVHVEASARPYQFQQHLYDKSQPETLDVVAQLRGLTDTYPDRMMVGEVFDDDDLARQRQYTDGPRRLHTAYSFHLLDATKATPALFAEAMAAWRDAHGWPSWSLGNHDVVRFPTRLGGPGVTAPQIDALLAALLGLRGTIFLFQGDELGLPQAHVPFERMRDPFARRTYTGDAGRDGARTPFPWTPDTPMAGFTTADDSWLPVDPAHPALAAAVQAADPASHLALTRRLIRLRRDHEALRTGDAEVPACQGSVLALLRASEAERILCVVNLDDEPAVFAHAELEGGQILLSDQGARLTARRLALSGFGWAFVHLAT